MLRKLLSILLIPFCFAIISAHGHAQQIDPAYQINWANSTGCSTVGAPYIPQSNTCVPMSTGLVQLNPTGAQTIAQPSLSQPLSVNFLAPMFVNGAVQASAFCGSGTLGGITLPSCSADACTKLLAANQYAVANGNPLVDASGFFGTQSCSVNPFNSLSSTIGAAVNLTVRFGATHFVSTAVWEITNSGITLDGAGPFSTQVEYSGTSCTSTPNSCGVLWVNTNTRSNPLAEQGGPNGMVIRDMSFYGDVANVTDAVILSSSRSRFDNIYTWGATGCGMHFEGVEESTFTHPVTSATAATFLGINNTSHTQPANGLCLDQDVNGINATTSVTISDPVEEGVTGIGIDVIAANNIAITGGTSEGNGTNGMVVGVHAGVANQQITVIGTDFEGNGSATGADVADNGANDTYIGILATSNSNSVFLNGNATVATDYILGGLFGPSGTSQPSGIAANGITYPGANAAGTCTITGAVQQLVRGTVVYFPYCATAP